MFPFLRSRSVRTSPATEIAFPYPIPNRPRLAVFAPVPMAAEGDPAELEKLNVQAVVAPMDMIRAIDPRRWSPEYPLVVVSQLGRPLMSDTDRDYIWHTFGVPAFEYLLDPASGRILARECEAHDGLHFDEHLDSHQFHITDEPCACGRPGPRVLGVADVII